MAQIVGFGFNGLEDQQVDDSLCQLGLEWHESVTSTKRTTSFPIGGTKVHRKLDDQNEHNKAKDVSQNEQNVSETEVDTSLPCCAMENRWAGS